MRKLQNSKMCASSYLLLSYGFTFTSISTMLEVSAIREQIGGSGGEKWAMAWPFARILQLQTPPMHGNDVTILQNLLRRHHEVSQLEATSQFDENTRNALKIFQKTELISPANGILNPETGKKIVERLMRDGYKDNGIVPNDCKFKIHVPLHRDRSIESVATLYKCGNGEVLHKFKIRARGGTKDGQPLNQLTTNGDTPTGLSTCDLNSRQHKAFVKSFGPYPIFRVVKGIEGNAVIGRDNFTGIDGRDTFLSNYRFGILIHTGIWDNWDESKPMPNTHGCMVVHPDDMKKLVDLVKTKTNTVVNKNVFSKLPYPYKTQGYISIEEVD